MVAMMEIGCLPALPSQGSCCVGGPGRSRDIERKPNEPRFRRATKMDQATAAARPVPAVKAEQVLATMSWPTSCPRGGIRTRSRRTAQSGMRRCHAPRRSRLQAHIKHEPRLVGAEERLKPSYRPTTAVTPPTKPSYSPASTAHNALSPTQRRAKSRRIATVGAAWRRS